MKGLIFFLFFLISFKALATRFYFNSDTIPGHFHYGDNSRSITQAQDSTTPWGAIWKLNAIFNTLNAGDSILLRRGGTFYGTIVVNKSGNSGSQIVIGAYGQGARPIVTGMNTLTWVAVSGTHLWRSNQTLNTKDVRMVTKNDLPIAMGRWPNVTNGKEGWNTIASVISGTSITQTTGNELNGQPSKYYDGTEIVYKAERFWIETDTITNYDPPTHRIDFSPGSPDDDPQDGWGYFIQNDSTILESDSAYQNAWWFKPNKYLKMYSVGSPSNIKAADLFNLVTSSGFQYVTFYNIDFNGCNNDIAIINSGGHIKFQSCIMRNAGRNAATDKSPNLTFLSDSIVNCQSKGITVVTSSGTNLLVTQCVIRNIGQFTGMGNGSNEDTQPNHSGVGIYIAADGANGATVQYNTIVNCGYSAVHFKRQNNINVSFNFIDTVDNVTDDGGGIYCYVNSSTPNSNRVIMNNIILHGIGSPYGWVHTANQNAGVAGIYGDRDADHITMTGNTIAYFEKGIFCNVGSNNITITGNTVYGTRFNSKYGSITTSMQINTRSADKSRNLTVTGNLLYQDLALTDQRLFTIHNEGDNLNSFGTINNNYYIKPLLINTSNKILSGQSGSTKNNVKDTTYSIVSWRVRFPYDDNTIVSPYFYSNTAMQDDSVIFKYNPNNSPLLVVTAYAWKDIYGTLYNNNFTIPAYSSMIVFRTSIPPPPPPTIIDIILRGRRIRVI